MKKLPLKGKGDKKPGLEGSRGSAISTIGGGSPYEEGVVGMRRAYHRKLKSANSSERGRKLEKLWGLSSVSRESIKWQ